MLKLWLYSVSMLTLALVLLWPTVANATNFVFGANEQVVYSTDFQNANGLVFENGTTNSLLVPGGIGIVNS